MLGLGGEVGYGWHWGSSSSIILFNCKYTVPYKLRPVLDRSWTGWDRSRPVRSSFCSTWILKDRSRSRSQALEVKKPDWTGLLNTTIYVCIAQYQLQLNLFNLLPQKRYCNWDHMEMCGHVFIPQDTLVCTIHWSIAIPQNVIGMHGSYRLFLYYIFVEPTYVISRPMYFNCELTANFNLLCLYLEIHVQALVCPF